MWAALVRHWTIVLVASALGLAAAIAFLAVVPAEYTAQTLIIIDPRGDAALKARIQVDANVDSANIESQVEILRSDQIIRQVVDNEGLTGDPSLTPGTVAQLVQGITRAAKFWDSQPKPDVADAAAQEAVIALGRRTGAKRLGLTYVVALTATMPDRTTAARVANAYARAFMTNQLRLREDLASRTSSALQERTQALQLQAQEAERAVEELKFSDSLQGQNSAAARVALKTMESTAQTYRVIHDKFLERYAETLQQQSFTVPDAQIVSAATPPLQKSYPRSAVVLSLGLAAGLSIGTLLVLWLDRRRLAAGATS